MRNLEVSIETLWEAERNRRFSNIYRSEWRSQSTDEMSTMAINN